MWLEELCFQQSFCVYHDTVCITTLLWHPGVRTRVQPVLPGIPTSESAPQLFRQYQVVDFIGTTAFIECILHRKLQIMTILQQPHQSKPMAVWLGIDSELTWPNNNIHQQRMLIWPWNHNYDCLCVCCRAMETSCILDLLRMHSSSTKYSLAPSLPSPLCMWVKGRWILQSTTTWLTPSSPCCSACRLGLLPSSIQFQWVK